MHCTIKINSKIQRGETMDIKEIENKINEVRYKAIDEILGNLDNGEPITKPSDQEIEQATVTIPRLEELKIETAFREGYLHALTSVVYFMNTGKWEDSDNITMRKQYEPFMPKLTRNDRRDYGKTFIN